MKLLKCGLLISSIVSLIFTAGCSQNRANNKELSISPAADGAETEPRYTYHEFDMITLIYRTDDIDAYKKQIPTQFQMPKTL